jgi:hypothetical protein
MIFAHGRSTATSTPSASSAAPLIGNLDPPASTTDPTVPIITQVISIGGLILGLTMLGLIIWLGLSRLSRTITGEIHTASLATLHLQHEAERLARREKVVFRAGADALSLLEQAILDASGESVHVRRRGPTQLLLGHATDLTAYPIDALNSTPFIVDDLSSAFGYVLARHQAPRCPLPRTDHCYLDIARPCTSRLPSWFGRHVRQSGMAHCFTDRVPMKTRSRSRPEQPMKTED